MKGLRCVLVMVTMGAAMACGDAPEEAEPAIDQQTEAEPAVDRETGSVPAWVSEVAGVANAIEARPGAMDSILAVHEMARATLDSLLYEIAADPVLTAAYREARER